MNIQKNNTFPEFRLKIFMDYFQNDFDNHNQPEILNFYMTKRQELSQYNASIRQRCHKGETVKQLLVDYGNIGSYQEKIPNTSRFKIPVLNARLVEFNGNSTILVIETKDSFLEILHFGS